MLLAVGWIPMTLIAVSLLGSYRSMAVSSRSTEIQNQCRILANQLLNYHYLEDPSSELINGELTQLASMYDGRILIIDKDFRAIQDTYDLIEGKYVASEEVIRCFQGQTSNKVTAQGFTVHYDTYQLSGDTYEYSPLTNESGTRYRYLAVK